MSVDPNGNSGAVEPRPVSVDAAGEVLEGSLCVPNDARGLVIFAHGSGSSRHSPRNKFVARALRKGRLGTLLFDLLTDEEEQVDLRTRHLRFDIGLLTERMVGAVDWAAEQQTLAALPIGLFGSSTGAAAALAAAAERPASVAAVVSRGGRPDLAGDALTAVESPTLLIVGGDDVAVIGMNEEAMSAMRAQKELAIVPGASHLFEEPGALESVAELAREWFVRFLDDEVPPSIGSDGDASG